MQSKLSIFIPVLILLANSLHAQECSRNNPADCLDGVGPAVFNPDNIRVTTTHITIPVDNSAKERDREISLFNKSLISGLAAGEGYTNWGFWGSFYQTNFDADIPINSLIQPIASYDANQNSFLVGTDRLLIDRLVIGLAGGYEVTGIATAYNGGKNNFEGYTIAPYLAYLINENFSFDISAGYSSLDYETDRIDNVSGGIITGEFDSNRWFFTSNIGATFNHGQWYLYSRIGYLYTEEDQDGYTETGPNTARTLGERHIDLGQIIFAVEVAYLFEHLEPYINLAYANDIGRDNGASAGGLPASVGATQPGDDDELQFYFGFRYYGNNFSGALEYGQVVTRDTMDSHNIMLTFRYDL